MVETRLCTSDYVTYPIEPNTARREYYTPASEHACFEQGVAHAVLTK